jgi:hypothetical protein
MERILRKWTGQSSIKDIINTELGQGKMTSTGLDMKIGKYYRT